MTSIRGKRTVEVHPVQRGYYPRNFHRDNTISDISNAWENLNEAKRVLNRAETRANEAAMPLSASDHQRSSNRRSPSHLWGITPTKDPVARVPGQEPLRSNHNSEYREYRRARKPKQRSRYHHGNSHYAEPYSGEEQSGLSRHGRVLPPSRTEADTGLDILERGPTELTLNDSTEVRVLNDMPVESGMETAYNEGNHTVEVSPGLKVNADYIPAYDQLYGERPVGATRTRPSKTLSHDRRTLPSQGKGLTLTQIEALRRKVELQKHQYRGRLDSPMPEKSHHQESDPVPYRQDSDYSTVLTGEYEQGDRTPMRKIARAPPAPHYRGFNLPETHYKLQDGRIVDEETINRKKNRKGKHPRGHTPREPTGGPNGNRTLQPTRTNRDGNQGRPTSKVHRKKAGTSGKEKTNGQKPIAASKVGAHAWREGQKVVRETLGPLRAVGRAKATHSPPTKDGRALDSGQPHASQENGIDGRDRPEASGGDSNPGQRSEQDENAAHIERSKLSSEAKDVLHDLDLDSEGESRHGDVEEEEKVDSRRQPLSFIVEPTKPPLGRSKVSSVNNQQGEEQVTKVRHYDSREVRRYMVQQKNRRKKKQQEEAVERREAEARKRRQLEELYRKQKDSTVRGKPGRVVPPALARRESGEKRPLDETYNKDPPPSVVVKPRRPPGEGRRFPPRTQAMRKLDVTSSDKENKAFWTTSSSDTSSRSSPQTDMAAQTVQASHPANQPPTGGDIILVPVTEEDAPISVVGRQKVPPSDGEVQMAQAVERTPGHEGGPVENEEPLEQPVELPGERESAKTPKPPAGQPLVTRPRTSNDERLQALKETASALHSRLDSEVKKLALSLRGPLSQTGPTVPRVEAWQAHHPRPDLQGLQMDSAHLTEYPPSPGLRREVMQSPHPRPNRPLSPRDSPSPLHDLLSHQMMGPGHSRMEHPLSPRHLTWHNQLSSPRMEDRWAFSVPSSRHPGPLGGVVDRRRQGSPSPFQTRHQRTLAVEEPNQVFTGTLPGIGSMNHHATESYRTRRQERAATTIQAAFRGHSVRQQMKWATQRHTPLQDGFRADHLTLSEGTLSDDVSVTAEEDYLPKFQSLRASPHQHLAEPSPSPVKPSTAGNDPQSLSSMLRTPSAFEPTNDGLSVIDIFTRRYQQAQRSLLASRPTQKEPTPPKSTPPEDQPLNAAPPSEDSQGGRLTRPTTLDYSDDDDFNTLSQRTQSSVHSPGALEHHREDVLSPHPQDRTDTSSFGVPDSERVVTGSEVTGDARKSPTSSHSSAGTTASISVALDGEHSVPESGNSPPAATPQQLRREVLNSPCSLPLSPTQDNHKPTSRSPQSDPGHRGVRRSPLGSNAYSSSEDEEAPRSVRSRRRRGRKSPSSRKSPALSPDAPRNFRPITSPRIPPSPPTSGPSPVSRPPPPSMPSMVGYSPGALQLKMASELNLLEMLDASSQQLAEMEHARTIALAHEESAALARVLQGRQADYERQLQLLNLKSRQEVEDAQRQLQDVREGYAETALAAQRDLVKSQQEAVDARRGAADRLLQTQAEASRITAEAARQLAEAQKAALAQPPPQPPVDVSKLTADSVHAGVSAALEQQRLQQQELLRDIRNGYKSPPPLRRSLGIGVSQPERSSPSALTADRSPTPHYTEDFTNSSTVASQSPSKVSSAQAGSSVMESLENTDGSRTIPTQVSSPKANNRDSQVANFHSGGRTTDERQDDRPQGPVSSMYSLQSVESENDSSIHTDSDAKRATTLNDTASVASISERADETKSVSDDKSLSFEHSPSEVESVVDTSERAPPRGEESRSELANGLSEPATSVQDTGQPVAGSQDLSRAGEPRLTADFIRQQLEEEQTRAQHQAALLNLRERALEEKTQAELQWLEYQKRQSKSTGDEDGLNLLRRKQRQLYARMTTEKEEIRILREAQASAGRKLQRLIEEQETIAKLQQSAQQSRAKVTTPLTPHLTSFESLLSEDSRSRVTTPSSPSNGGIRDRMSPLFGAVATAPPEQLSPAEMQVKALQSAKLSARSLSKRAVSLRKRRKEAEELLAWKQKLDEEEEEVKRLEERVKSRLKTAAKPSSRSSPQLTTPTQESAAPTPSEPHSESNSEVSERLESVSSGVGKSKSRSKVSGGSSGGKSKSKSRSEDKSVPEEISVTPSSIDEEIVEGESSQSKTKNGQSKSKKSAGLNSSGEETVKDVSPGNDYTSESFDSSIDQTLTQNHTPSPSRNNLSVKSSPIWLSPRHGRRRPEPESGSESERSLSQTFSETASDQSDIEGRIRALSDSLKKRKVEADKLRKQQKRLYREKLKAQEASLKKQLETYDSFIDQTRKELIKETDASHSPPLVPGAKPQIKQLSISETQRRRDQSHTRALRQRTASESSVEGSSVDIAKKRGLGGGRHTQNRSTSIEEEPAYSPRDLREGHEGEKRKSTDPTTRSRSLSGDSSVTEDISLRSLEDQSISDVSLTVSTKSKEKPETEETREHFAARRGDESTATVTPDHRSRGDLIADGVEATDQRGPGSRPTSSDIPEEIPSGLSEASSTSRPVQRLHLLEEEEEEGSDVEGKEAEPQDVFVKSSRDVKDAGSSQAEEELPPQQSPRTESRTGSSKTASSKRSPRVDQSYSEDFQESSMTIDIRESKSDTEDDISEHLSDRSTASGESQVSEKFVARPSREETEVVQEASVVVSNDALDDSALSHHQGETEALPSSEVTISPQRPEEVDGGVAMPATKSSVVVPVGVADPLPGIPVGSRVDTDGYGSGVLRFKGQISSRNSSWIGVELDQPNGSSDGTHDDGTSYFQCPDNHGVFVTPDRVREEIERAQSTSLVDDRAQDKSQTSFKFPEDLHTGDYTDDAESIIEEISEGVTDDAALQKVIISTAEAVESFSIDRDEPEGIESPQDTPRVPPPVEEETQSEERAVPSPELVERLANDLIEEVIKESLEGLIGAMEKERIHDEGSKEDGPDKSNSLSFLELITPPEGEVSHDSPTPSVPEEQEVTSRGHLVEMEVNSVLDSLVSRTVGEMIKLRESRDQKWNTKFSPTTPDKPVRLADLDRLTTLQKTPDGAGTAVENELDTPLPDDLFVNKVQVDSAISGIRDGDDATPRARPTSPIFGESGSISPQALCDKLEQLQALDQDIFGADIFGGQEWFDDDFGSMPKTNSIIQVPPRGMDEGRSPSPEEPLPKYNEARKVEPRRVIEEQPFMAVPHNEAAVGGIVEKAVEMVHRRAEVGNPISPLSPTHAILGADTFGSDIESTSRKAYKRLVFDLAKETYRSVKEEQEKVSNPPWMKPKRRPRKYLFRESPRSLGEMHTAVNSQALRVIGLGPRPTPGGAPSSKYALKKKRDRVDEILIQELREEEQEWVDYNDDELSVKMQLSDAIFASLLADTVSVVSRIQESRSHRTRTVSQSDSDIEF